MAWVTGFASGIVLWTLLEYVLHRFVFHRSLLGRWAARGHVRHHAQPDYFYAVGGKLALAAIVLVPIGGAAALALGPALGSSIPAGIVVGWLIYEWVHRRIHTHAPIGPYGRWARRHHLRHHFGAADRNHGVTTPVWDLVFGTLAPRAVVRIPRRQVEKLPWLLDANACAPAIAARFEAEYLLV